ncbi:heavy metal sensor histidine kinase [Variovorax sp.]|uniref:heavy metal sensor histidine kinase n=1 Tax=Variovorax sp. TaxID=1871043 RepID=UPI002D535EB0|nr:heavy metal sensor histidine kinase [Variovorax sp.]HYP86470.1 heavy metal sensor histidine kinase [Variovorax sp.]
MSIQASLSRWLAAQALVVLSLVLAAVYGVTSLSFGLKQADALARQADIVRHMVAEGGPFDAVTLRNKVGDHFAAHQDARVTLRRGDELLYESNPPSPSVDWITRQVVIADALPGGVPVQLQLSLEVGADRLLLRRLAWTLVGAAVAGTLLVSVTGALLVRRGLQPLKQLARETAAAGPGDPGRRVDAAGYASELQPWIVQFNALLQRVEDAYAQLESFNADVAHELRTPLSNLIAQAEVELGRTRTVGEMQAAMASQLDDVRRLSAIVTDMLFLSKADRGVQARRGAPESLAALVQQVADYYDAMLEDSGFVLQVQGDTNVAMDASLVRRAVSNLVSNAVGYATPGTPIVVEIRRDGAYASLAVRNSGPVIGEQAMSRLFERFYRADMSRIDSAHHHGLGLAIVAAIARMHGGSTFASSERGQTRIGLRLAEPTSPGQAPAGSTTGSPGPAVSP